jgi:tRNA pseudouridine38-40 synthase
MKTLLTIAYDGSNYSGWQRQSNATTVQAVIEKALSKLFGRASVVVGASRTDAGVHAAGQRAAFRVEPNDPPIPPEKIPYAVNPLLPDDIRVLSCRVVPDSFDPIRNAIQKTYEYRIYNETFHDPAARLYSAHVPARLDLAAIKEAARHLVGEHDFAAFAAAGGGAKTTTRTIFSLDLSREGSMITIAITGGGFLYNMARIIAGTLVYAGMGKIAPSALPEIILSKDRTRAGKTMAAKGLTLKEIIYGA